MEALVCFVIIAIFGVFILFGLMSDKPSTSKACGQVAFAILKVLAAAAAESAKHHKHHHH